MYENGLRLYLLHQPQGSAAEQKAFQPADHQDLVVYADTPAPLIELKPPLNELLNLVAKAKTVGSDFRSTSIITTTNRLVFDLLHDPVVLPMPIISNPLTISRGR